MNTYLVATMAAVIYFAGLGTGWELNGLRLKNALETEKASHQADLNKLSTAAALALKNYQDAQQKQLKDVADLQQTYQEAIDHAQQDNADLQSRVDAGSSRLLIAAHCPTNSSITASASASASVINGQAAELDSEVRSNYYAFRQSLQIVQGQLEGLQDYIHHLQEQGLIANY